MSEGIYSLTAPAVMAHPTLITPRGFGPKGKEKGEPRYGASFLFKPDSADLAEMKKLCAKVAKAKWPSKSLADLAFPFVSGDKLADKRKEKSGKDDGAFQRGHVILKAKTKIEPALAYIESGRIVELTGADQRAANSAKFFFGAEVYAVLNFVAYNATKDGEKDGVTCYLNGVMATGKGTKIAGGPSLSETFRGYVGQHSAEDPTAGVENLDDEISF